MSEGTPRLLFVPVSGAFGMGEYARALAIAEGALARWPDAAVRFVLSRAAPYAATSPMPATLLESSPTFHTAAVVELIGTWRPDVVIFDNAGRTAQLAAARRQGARVVYISARRRQRRKAFRCRWMRLIDEHWIAYPEFIAGSLGALERVKLGILHRPQVRFLDVILARRAGAAEPVLDRLGCTAGGYALVVPGGGTGHPGALSAVDRFLEAARGLAAAGLHTVFVGGPAVAEETVRGPAAGSTLTRPGALPQADLADLMRGARLVITNGGSTLLQAIACGRPCLAAAIAGDQAERIRRCVAAGVAIAAPADLEALRPAAVALLADEAALLGLAQRAAALGLADGVDVALGALARWVGPA